MTTKRKSADSPSSKSRFAESILAIAYRFSLSQVFDDFLTMSIAAFTQNPATYLSYYETEYLQIIAKYKDSDLRHEFPKALAYLIEEMETRFGSSEGNDVLGEFFEEHISSGRNGQYFTPFHICRMMSEVTHGTRKMPEDGQPLRILDPSCGSGRMLMASHIVLGPGHAYYGIDIDLTCVKMAAINLFLHGMWHSEVLCANALIPGDFVLAYRISMLPLGIFKIETKETSTLWHMQQEVFSSMASSSKKASIVSVLSTPYKEVPSSGEQLDLFGNTPPK